jgi:hypothetical protein
MVVLEVLLPSTAWYIPHLEVSCVDHNSSRIGAIAHNSNRGSSNSNSRSSSSSTVPLLHHCSKLPSGHHSSFPPTTIHASTAGKWVTLLENAVSPSKATHHEPRHHQQRDHQKGPAPWAGYANYTTVEEIPMGQEVLVGTFFLNNILLLFCSILEHLMIL